MAVRSAAAAAAVVTDSRLGGQGPSTSVGDDPRPPLERPPPSNPAASLSTDAYGCITTATDNSALAATSSEHYAPSVVAGVAISSQQQNGHGYSKASSFYDSNEMSSVHRLLDPARDGNAEYPAYPPPRLPDPSGSHPLSGRTSSTTAPGSAYPSLVPPSQHLNDAPGSAHSSSSTVASSVSLPSMRTLDSITQQTQHGTQDLSPGLGINLPPPQAQSPTAYHHPSGDSSAPPLSAGYSLHPETLSRYALPPDPRSQYRSPKKQEIKRRTKTGCLTCRKRRIKCDETHPTCNNCKKSKRECLGYGPIFRPTTVASDSYQSQLPARKPQLASPGGESASSPSVPSTSPRPGSHDLAGSDSYPRPLTAGSSTQPSILNTASSLSPTGFQRGPLSASTATSPYTPASYSREPSTPASISSPRSRTESGAPLSNTDISREASRPSLPLPKTSLEFLTHSHSAVSSRHATRAMKVEDLINSWGPPPPVPEQIQSENTYQEVVKVYHEMYAPGLHAFFESTWFYFSEHGKMSFPRQGNLIGQMAVFLKVLEGVKVNDHAQMSYSNTLELRLVWELAKLASFATSDTADNRNRASLPAENDRLEVMNRFYIVQALLNGEFVPWNPLTPPTQDANHHRVREFDFWYQLGEFLRITDGEQEADRVQRRDDALGKLRGLLDGRENRDVLYSIVVLRQYAHRFDLAQALQAKYHLPEEEPRNKVVVASKFISSQAHVTGGTTNVVRRICDIAARLYVNSGDNIRLTGRP